MSHEVRISERVPLRDGVFNWFKSHFHPSKRFPIINTLKNYRIPFIKGDIVAGITVGLLLVPQALAMADIVGIKSVHGLYTSLMGPISSIFFSTCPDNSVGPTVLVSVVAARFNGVDSPVYMSVLSFFSGMVMIVAGILNAGVFMKLVSSVVVSSFMTVGSLTIIISQLPTLFGIRIEKSGELDSYSLIYKFFSVIQDTKPEDFAIGISCVIACLVLHYMLPVLNQAIRNTSSKAVRIPLEIIWFIFIAKNAILTVLMTAVAYALTVTRPGSNRITLTGQLQSGFPVPMIPFRSGTDPNTGESIPLSDVLNKTAPGFVLVPILMFVETLMVVKSFSRMKNYEADITQEIINVGIANVLTSFFQGFPIGGALSRSAVNSVSGVKSTLSGIVTFIILILALMVLTPVFFYIPKASLAGMLIAAVIPNIDFAILGVIWRAQKWEYLPWCATFFAGLYALEYGMMAGVGLSAAFIIFREIRPMTHKIHHTHRFKGSYTFRLRTSVRYPGAEFVMDKIMSFKKRCPDITQLYIDCHAMQETDMTVATELLRVILKMKSEQDVSVNLQYVKSGSVRNIFEVMGLGPYILNQETVDVSNCRHCHRYHVHGNTDHIDMDNSKEIVPSAQTRYFIKTTKCDDNDLEVPDKIKEQLLDDTKSASLPAEVSNISSSTSTSDSDSESTV